MAKESLFNILHHQYDWSTLHFLDLFSGIGSISLEACSRGAKEVRSVDLNRNAYKWLRKVSSDLALQNLSPVCMDAFKWLDRNEQKFDLVFADPPYDFSDYEKLIDTVLKKALQPDGSFVLEHRQSGSFVEHHNFVEERTYGEVKFSFFKI